jgi:hypothetical protein
VSGRYSGIGQAVLRVSAKASEAAVRNHLDRAYRELSEAYYDEPVYVTLTANVVLKSTTSSSYSLYFGQSFGSARAVFFGQEHDPVSGELTRLFSEYVLESRADLASLPVNFTTEDFAAIYKRNFSKSNVVVKSVVSLVYIFSTGLERYERDHTLDRTPLRVF